MISPKEWLEHPGSVGKPFPGNEFEILDDDGNSLPPGEVGTIYAKPAASSFEYHNDPDKTASSHRGQWFTVGDAGYLDEDGYLYLTDRKSDMVISGGVNIYPREIEDSLHQHPDVVDCAVLGVPDDRWGEILYAVVQPRAGASLDADGVITWCRENLADYKRPRVVEFVDELPRDPNGKVRKPKLREAWLARAARVKNRIAWSDEEGAMPYYLIQTGYTSESWEKMIKKPAGPSRRGPARDRSAWRPHRRRLHLVR